MNATYIVVLDTVDWRELEYLGGLDKTVKSYLRHFEYDPRMGYVMELAKTEFCMLLLKIETVSNRTFIIDTLKSLGKAQDKDFIHYLGALRQQIAKFC